MAPPNKPNKKSATKDRHKPGQKNFRLGPPLLPIIEGLEKAEFANDTTEMIRRLLVEALRHRGLLKDNVNVPGHGHPEQPNPKAQG